MSRPDFSTSFNVKETPQQVFDAVTRPRDWWSQEIEGRAAQVGDEFSHHYREVHRCRLRVIEAVPTKRMVWQVLENYFDFTRDKSEWVGTRIVFEIAHKAGKTELRFTHEGLVPTYECYGLCTDAWSTYIAGSLRELITTGRGAPNPKE